LGDLEKIKIKILIRNNTTVRSSNNKKKKKRGNRGSIYL
jgi:hypothetical protein